MSNQEEVQSYEQRLFPELKQYHKLKSKIKTIKKSEISGFDDYILIKSEIFRRGQIAEEALFVNKSDYESLNDAILEIEKIRKEKQFKKIGNHLDNIKKKEIKFNKIYEKENLPNDARKEAYKHFVLNKDSYIKHIKKERIIKYITDIDIYDNKDKRKKIKKILEDIVSKNSELLSISDYCLMHKVLINTKYHNISFQRDLNILAFNKENLSEEFSKYISDPEKAIQDIVDDKLNEITLSETTRINDIIEFIKKHIEIRNIDKGILNDALSEVLDIYNKDDVLYKFILTVFIKYSFKSDYFSKKQRETFVNRRKFRNRVEIELSGVKFETCFYLKFNELKKDFINLLNGDDYINEVKFTKFLKIKNEETLTKKMNFAKHTFENEVDYQFKNLLKNSDVEESVLKSSNLKELLEKLIIKNLARPPENRRIEILPSRIREILIGEKDEINGLVEKAILDKLMKINYKDSFPIARAKNRKFKFFVGKTNSGKTYKAFNELVKYNSGAYLSPLRLLALEGQEEILSRNKKCNMITGEEKSLDENAKFTSSTIEMLDLKKEVDCIVIDEIQMIKDKNRGWAWTQAVIGAPAENIILAGSDEVLNLIKEILSYTGDTLEIEYLERKSPLKVMSDVVDFKNIKKGTAIIAFSRKDILKYKMLLKNRKTSTIYGNLGPEIRKEESRKFREGETDILIATDAIAMGLNLPIETILFTTFRKSIRGEKIELDEQLVQQIGGRAGRYGLKNVGYVGATNRSTLSYIKDVMSRPIPEYTDKAPIMPHAKYLKDISEITKVTNFKKLMISFQDFITKDDGLFSCTDLTKIIELSEEIEKYNLSIEDNLRLTAAPVKENNDSGIYYFNKYVSSIVESFYLDSNDKKEIKSPSISKFGKRKKTNDIFYLEKAEEKLHIIDLYNWFSLKYEDIFSDIDDIEIKKAKLNEFIIQSLNEINLKKIKKSKK